MPKKKNRRVAVAMSGGVDSSTALAILKEEGYDCVGVSMQLWDYSKRDDGRGATAGSCCSIDDIHDARRVAEKLGVPFYVVNLEDVFSREVVGYFVESYAGGVTPNPCVKCNQILKFDSLLKKAVGALEADYLATGHYARIEASEDGYRLLKGVDGSKDQSYFLFTMTRGQLGSVLFPLGALTKKEVRLRARELGLSVSEKPESQEICFVEEPRYADFLAGRLPLAGGEGKIVDREGRVLGPHSGLFNYTVGQRKGLNLSGGPYYVTGIDVKTNRLTVGRSGDLCSNGLVARHVNWISDKARAMAGAGNLTGITAKIRYRHPGAESAVRMLGTGEAQVIFKDPQKAVAPGQAVVFYRGDELLGGGWIERAL